MAVAHSMFTLCGQVQFFWTAFDLIFTVVPLKVVLGYKKLFFWAFQKIIMDIHLTYTCMIIFLKCPKINFSQSLSNFSWYHCRDRIKRCQNNWTPPSSKVNIGSARAIFLKKIFSKFFTYFGKKYFLNKWL